MTEKRNVTSDPTVDKLTLFRQQECNSIDILEKPPYCLSFETLS